MTEQKYRFKLGTTRFQAEKFQTLVDRDVPPDRAAALSGAKIEWYTPEEEEVVVDTIQQLAQVVSDRHMEEVESRFINGDPDDDDEEETET